MSGSVRSPVRGGGGTPPGWSLLRILTPPFAGTSPDAIVPRRMDAPRTPAQIRVVNERYHDAAAGDYDAKWGIDFGAKGRRQVLGKLDKVLGRGPHGPFDSALEIGAGTGYFTLNLLQAGVVRRASCVDISPGMLRTLRANARELGLEVRTRACDAEALPFEDASFDLVFGHAVLHHLPDLEQAFA